VIVTTMLDAGVDPGTWMLHCHNSHHAERGMMTTLRYV
jgi:FtsP/CotA-like multicopper oxidase with cupredoxin domain